MLWSMHDLSWLFRFIFSRAHTVVAHVWGSESLSASIRSLSTVLSECYGQACWWQTPVQSHCHHPGRWAKRSHQPESWILVWIFCRPVEASGLRWPLSSGPSRTGSGCQKGVQTPHRSWAGIGWLDPVFLSPWESHNWQSPTDKPQGQSCRRCSVHQTVGEAGDWCYGPLTLTASSNTCSWFLFLRARP